MILRETYLYNQRPVNKSRSRDAGDRLLIKIAPLSGLCLDLQDPSNYDFCELQRCMACK